MRSVTFVEEVNAEAIFWVSLDPFLLQDGTSLSVSFGCGLDHIVTKSQRDFLTEISGYLAENLRELLTTEEGENKK